jgi:hypothetical protein
VKKYLVLASCLSRFIYAEDFSHVIPKLDILAKPGAVIPAPPTNCSNCKTDQIHATICPEFLKTWSADDKKNKIVSSNFKTCMSNIGTKIDYSESKGLYEAAEQKLLGDVPNEVLNSLKACSQVRGGAVASEAQHLVAKSAATLLRFENAEADLYHQIAVMDSFLGDKNGLDKEDCINRIFDKIEKYCHELKANCARQATSDIRTKLIANTLKVEEEAIRLTNEIKNGGKDLDQNKQALAILKLGSPWVFGENFVKERKKGADAGTALTKQFEVTRSGYLNSLNKFKSTANCYIGTSNDCRPEDFNVLLQLTPSLPSEKSSKWNLNMSAQECVADFSFDRDEAAHKIYSAGIDAVAGLATMGIGLLPNAARALKLASYVKTAAATSEAIILTANTHFAVEGVEEAIAACTDKHKLVALGSKSEHPSSCSVDNRLNLGQLSEQGNCLTSVAIAMLNGLPLGQMAKEAYTIKAMQPSTVVKIPLNSNAVLNATKEATKKRIKDSNEAYLAAAHEGPMKTGRTSYDGLDADPALGYNQTLELLKNKSHVRVADLGGGEGIALENICKQLPKDARCILISLKSHAKTEGQTKVFKDRNFDGIAESELRGISKEELGLIHSIKDPAEQARALNESGLDVATDFFGVAAYSGDPAVTLKHSVALLKVPVDGKPGGVLFQHLGIHPPGSVGDFFGKNNKIITKDGQILDYSEWLKTIKGLHAEVYSKSAVREVRGADVTETANAKITLIPGEKVIIPELEPIHFRFPKKGEQAIVPRGIFIEKGAAPISLPKVQVGIKVEAPVVTTASIKDTSANIITQGTPDKVLSSFVTALGGKGEIVINLGHEKTGFGDSTDIISNKGQSRTSLVTWMQNIPGIKVSIKRSQEKATLQGMGREFNDKNELIDKMGSFTHTYFPQTATIKVTDLEAFEKYMKENPLSQIGNGKPGSEGLPTAMYITD